MPPGAGIRPTTDALREALFGSLGERVVGARFADLYAGCGSVGIEALSRGASRCVFVDRDPRCTKVIGLNLTNTHLRERGKVVKGAAERVWRSVWSHEGLFDIVFADPPYGDQRFRDLWLRLVVHWEGVALDGLVVVQCDTRVGDPPGAVLCVVKRQGDSELRFYQRPEPVSGPAAAVG